MAIQQGVDTGLWGAASFGYELGDYGRMVLWVCDSDSEILWCNNWIPGWVDVSVYAGATLVLSYQFSAQIRDLIYY